MTMLNKLIRTSIITIGSFTAGILFEKNFRLHADVGADDLQNNRLITMPDDGDVVDSIINYKGAPYQSINPSPPSRGHIAQISKFGFPSLDSLRSYANFILSYDRRNRVANWVLEYVTPEHLASKEYDRSGIDFREDKSFHHFFRATNQDYKGSGYDRGHLAAAGNYRSNPDHIKETYVLSNIAPQIGKGFNRDKWNELEKYCRKKVNDHKGVWICTGPLYLPQKDPNTGKQFVRFEVIGHNHVAVPTHFFKVLLYQVNGKYFIESFLMPNRQINEKASLDSFRINPEVIERSAGILLFNNIPRNTILINP